MKSFPRCQSSTTRIFHILKVQDIHMSLSLPDVTCTEAVSGFTHAPWETGPLWPQNDVTQLDMGWAAHSLFIYFWPRLPRLRSQSLW